jgi:hypothetical protein
LGKESSFRQKPESSFDFIQVSKSWIPAFAGMTNYDTASKGGERRVRGFAWNISAILGFNDEEGPAIFV